MGQRNAKQGQSDEYQRAYQALKGALETNKALLETILDRLSSHDDQLRSLEKNVYGVVERKSLEASTTEIKKSERVILDSVSKLQTNLDILSNRQMKSDLEIKKTEKTITAKLKEWEEKIVNGQFSKPQGRKDEEYFNSEEDYDSETDQNAEIVDGGRSNSKGRGSKPQAKGHRSRSAKSNTTRIPQARTQSNDRKTLAIEKTEMGDFPPFVKATSPGDLYLRVYNCEKLLGSQRSFNTNAQFYDKLGGTFKGVLRFCANSVLQFILMYEPVAVISSKRAPSGDTMFSYSVRILNPDKNGIDWFIVLGSQKSLSDIRTQKWGTSYGIVLTSIDYDEARNYLSENGRDELRIVFFLEPC